jgi:uncharacterized membrane protein YphA (DoxX/SURF4 family)
MTAKSTNTYYWILTGLFAALMFVSGIPDILMIPEAVAMVTDHLGYPAYFLPFIGVAKVLGAICILLPRFPRLKEWAYAGFFYDLLAAMWSGISVGDPPGQWLTILIAFALLFGSYALHHRRLNSAQNN